MDNGSSHRGEGCVRRLQNQMATHYSGKFAYTCQQIEIYFSIVQRKVLTHVDTQSQKLKNDYLDFKSDTKRLQNHLIDNSQRKI